ncbi:MULTISPECIES: TetR/AcrR family transcriptional regulator [Streptosporangium]|uniref:AcrR family transcriptional regulator n=1 Tax=Streptosporangium brasiliense TaxID=47480 RepID=A0ABT9RFZ4_9ACTN|nr:TetR/AcrR family transcriptional regulator [Streptosporangium brasiliense]MDP9867649.1 AcrR family transcriptional regulator [Streptosporangium brasiliense]
MTRPAGTRERLITAAEELFSTRGIGAVSLNEIVRTSGARNATALQYHFGDRAGLLRAVLGKHGGDVDARRHAMLDDYERGGGPGQPRTPSPTDTGTPAAEPTGAEPTDPRTRPPSGPPAYPQVLALAAALVRPPAAKLADPDGGPAYLRIMAELIGHPGASLATAEQDDPAASIHRWRRLAAPLLQEDAVRLHRRLVAIRFTMVELGRRARSGPHPDDRLFVSHLVDLVAALLLAPLSEETLRLAAERGAETAG